jgi:hypothetical protein
VLPEAKKFRKGSKNSYFCSLEKNISPSGRDGEWKPANISWENCYEKLKRKTGKTKDKRRKAKKRGVLRFRCLQ